MLCLLYNPLPWHIFVTARRIASYSHDYRLLSCDLITHSRPRPQLSVDLLRGSTRSQRGPAGEAEGNACCVCRSDCQTSDGALSLPLFITFSNLIQRCLSWTAHSRVSFPRKPCYLSLMCTGLKKKNHKHMHTGFFLSFMWTQYTSSVARKPYERDFIFFPQGAAV